jgi:hypothetical protein
MVVLEPRNSKLSAYVTSKIARTLSQKIYIYIWVYTWYHYYVLCINFYSQYFYLFIHFFETNYCHVAQARIKFEIFLPQSPKCWDY